MRVEPVERGNAKIEFEQAEGGEERPTLRISGIPHELLSSPEKIRQLMEILELPAGTKAHVTVATSSVIIR